jgi:hypothetical protein
MPKQTNECTDNERMTELMMVMVASVLSSLILHQMSGGNERMPCKTMRLKHSLLSECSDMLDGLPLIRTGFIENLMFAIARLTWNGRSAAVVWSRGKESTSLWQR